MITYFTTVFFPELSYTQVRNEDMKKVMWKGIPVIFISGVNYSKVKLER